MKNLPLLEIIEKYPNWKLINNSEDLLSIKLKNTDVVDFNEVLDVVKFVNENVSFVKFSIQISKITESKFVIIISQSNKKYNRMYTSGCFDIFHFGHLNILKKTKELCDYLIVGVSTDELIEKEKGRLPVIPFIERINVVKSIKFVDEAIPQTDKDKQKIVDLYNIDAISVGDDWKGRFPKTTCPVEYFEYTPNVSSTILKSTLKL